MGFEGKVVLVTGGSSGIGADAALHLSKLGAKVAIVGRNKKKLSEVADVIKKSVSFAPLTIVADVTKDAERIVNETVQHFGKLDILVNNAGFGITDSAIDVDLSEFDRVFDTNVRSVLNLTKLSIPHLEKTKGNVVNISSLAGLKPVAGFMTYCMSKSALDQYTKCAALDLAPKGIRVNSVNPAAIRTSFIQNLGMTKEVSDSIYKGMINQYPVGRIGEVADTSAAIAFLANNETASFLTGIILTVDGGSFIAGVQVSSEDFAPK